MRIFLRLIPLWLLLAACGGGGGSGTGNGGGNVAGSAREEVVPGRLLYYGAALAMGEGVIKPRCDFWSTFGL